MAYFHCLIGGGSSGGGYELTVTCDADFAGTTITATDGVTTLTQTCPSASPYEVVFEIPNGGDWTISGVVSGQTVTTGVNIPTTAELIAFVHKTITIYSATEDTITYTDVFGDTQTEVFASGESSKQITVDIEPNGSSITFTSGVAKDPSDLSNAYSKTVLITRNTTDVYLMPDTVWYWYGYKLADVVLNTNRPSGTQSTSTVGTATYNTNSLRISSSNNYSCAFFETPNYVPSANGNVKFITKSSDANQMLYLTSSDVNNFPVVSTVSAPNTKQVSTLSFTSSATRIIPVIRAYQSNYTDIDAIWVDE